jgi:integrase
LKVQDLSEHCRVLTVRRSVWRLHEQTPKTPNALRIVDVHETLARVLRECTAGKTGLLFHTQKGKPLSQRNVLRALLKSGATCGFHGFRRFRTETLRKERVPEDLIKLWLGHASATVINRRERI